MLFFFRGWDGISEIKAQLLIIHIDRSRNDGEEHGK